MNTKLDTVSGMQIDLAKPEPSSIRMDDIFWSLSMIARYGGHTSTGPYTVAQHSVLVWKMVKDVLKERATIAIQLRALCHDFHEAYMGDFVAQVGDLIEFRQPLLRLRQRLNGVIYTAMAKDIGMEHAELTEKIDPQLMVSSKAADMFARYYEQNYLQRHGAAQLYDYLGSTKDHERSPYADWVVEEIKKREPFVVQAQGAAYHSLFNVYSGLKQQWQERKYRSRRGG